MLQSMTGFGQAHRETDRYTATVELRSLNSKTLDLSLRLPRFLQTHELDIHQQITKALLRGKVNFSLDFTRTTTASTAAVSLNREALLAAFHELQAVAQSLGLPTSEDTLLAALRLPGVIPSASEQAQAAQAEAGGHRDQNPHGEEAVQERQPPGDRPRGRHCGGGFGAHEAAPAGAVSVRGCPAGRVRIAARRSVICGSSR